MPWISCSVQAISLWSNFVDFRSNLLGTHFTLFDHGDNPRKNAEGARQELVAIAYVSLFLVSCATISCILSFRRFAFIDTAMYLFVCKAIELRCFMIF